MENPPLSFGCRGEAENPKGLGTVGLCPLLSGPGKMAPISPPFAKLGMRRNRGFPRKESLHCQLKKWSWVRGSGWFRVKKKKFLGFPFFLC